MKPPQELIDFLAHEAIIGLLWDNAIEDTDDYLSYEAVNAIETMIQNFSIPKGASK